MSESITVTLTQYQLWVIAKEIASHLYPGSIVREQDIARMQRETREGLSHSPPKTCPYRCEMRGYVVDGELCIGTLTDPHPATRLRTSVTK